MTLQEVHTGFTFSFDGSKLAAIQKGVGRASTNLNTVAQHVDTMGQKMGGMLERTKQILAVYVGFRGVKALTVDFAMQADAIGKTAEGLGIAVSEYSALEFVAKSGGIEITQLGNAMGKLSRRASEAAKGSKENKKIFSDMGISVHDTNGKLKNSLELLLDVSNKFKGMKQGSDKTRLALKLFEETGARFVNTMNLGADGIKKLMAEAKRLGVVIDAEGAKKAAAFNDAMLKTKSILLGIRNTIALRLLPAITKQLDAFRKWWLEGKNAERALRALKLVAIFTAIVVAQLIGAKILRNLKLFVQGVWAGVQAIRAMGLAAGITAIKVWAIVAAFALVALAIEDLVAFAQGKDSVIGRLLGDTKLAKELKKALLDMGKEFKKAWKDMAPALASAWTQIKLAVGDLWKVVKPLIGPAFRGAVSALIVLLEVVTTLVSGITNVVKWMSQAWDDANAAVHRWDLAVNAAAASMGKAITGAWNDANAAVNKVLVSIEDGAKAAAKAVGGAWDSALGGLKSALDAITSAAITAYRAVAAALGLSDVGGALNIDTFKAAAAAAAIKLSAGAAGGPGQRTSTGGPIMPGLLQPFGGLTGGPIRTFAPGPGFHVPSGVRVPPDITTNIAAGAVQVPVTVASGDPAAIAKAINAALPPAISEVFTKASRDLVKAPQGQR